MYANRVIVEVVKQNGLVVTSFREFDSPQTLVEVESDLWRKVGRKPAVCLLSQGTARVIFQEGRRVTDTFDCLGDLVFLALRED